MTNPSAHKCIIVGSGFSGICLAIKLKTGGITDFVILEKAQGVGGTWRDNHYPGAECDVPSALYSFSFETKTDWDYQWSEQPQILEYIRNTVCKNGITDHIRFGCELVSADYEPEKGQWRLELANGEVLHSQFLVSAVGQLHKPRIPELSGMGSFNGAWFHSANWNHAVDLCAKSVAVIGNAASAVQFVPFVAKDAARLWIFQRSANWVCRKNDKPYKDWEKKLMRIFPASQRLSRLKIYLRNELIAYTGINGNRLTRWMLKMACQSYLNKAIPDESLRRKLQPDYPVGAKRILVADGYYEALTQKNVELVTDPIAGVDETGILTKGGRHFPCDVIIFGTGFITNPFLDGIAISGKSGRALADHWSDGARAYLGITTSEFPNLFFMYGPNTNLGHNSILLMAESQADYIVQAINSVAHRNSCALEVRADVEAQYNLAIQTRLQTMVWNSVSDSWYKSGGRITNNWPGSVGEYRRVTRKFCAQDFVIHSLVPGL
jgi:cation diffusion facilitator CzcD-associated flavoprotein CzcO